MSPTAIYSLPLVPGGVFLAALVLLLVVPVFALAALAAALLVLLGALAAALVAAPLLAVRLARRHWPPRLASWPMRARPVRESLDPLTWPLDTKGRQ